MIAQKLQDDCRSFYGFALPPVADDEIGAYVAKATNRDYESSFSHLVMRCLSTHLAVP